MGSAFDIGIYRDAANTLALRNGANAQTFNWYATYTDAANYEGGYLTAAAGSVTLGARTLGTGTDDIDLILSPAGVGATKFMNTVANGVVATVITGLGPVGASATIQGWIKIKEAGGTVRFVPYW